MTTSRQQILDLLAARQDEVRSRFSVRRLALFGSAARDELATGSDIDVLVEFDGPASYEGFFALKDYLESLFDRPVDLVSERGLKPRARRHVERDLVRIA